MHLKIFAFFSDPDVLILVAGQLFERVACFKIDLFDEGGVGGKYLCQGAVSIRKTVLPGMAIPMLKIRRPNGRLIFNMEIAIRR